VKKAAFQFWPKERDLSVLFPLVTVCSEIRRGTGVMNLPELKFHQMSINGKSKKKINV